MGMEAYGALCGQAYHRLGSYSAGPEVRRLDRAIAWRLEALVATGPGIQRQKRLIAQHYLDLGLYAQAAEWGEKFRAGRDFWPVPLMLAHYALGDDQPIREQMDAMVNQYESKNLRQGRHNYGYGAVWAANLREWDLAVASLDKGMAQFGLESPIDLLLPEERGEPDRNGLAIELALACQEAGRPEDAALLLEESRYRDPFKARFTDLYTVSRCDDAAYEAVTGNLAEAMRLLRLAFDEWHKLGAALCTSPFRLRHSVVLDPLRNDPEYGPQLQALIDEVDAYLEPQRQAVLAAEAIGDWDALRVLPE